MSLDGFGIEVRSAERFIRQASVKFCEVRDSDDTTQLICLPLVGFIHLVVWATKSSAVNDDKIENIPLTGPLLE